MEEETKRRLDMQEKLLEKIYVSVEKTRKYFSWTIIASLVVFIIPLIGLMIMLPKFLNTYISILK